MMREPVPGGPPRPPPRWSPPPPPPAGWPLLLLLMLLLMLLLPAASTAAFDRDVFSRSTRNAAGVGPGPGAACFDGVGCFEAQLFGFAPEPPHYINLTITMFNADTGPLGFLLFTTEQLARLEPPYLSRPALLPRPGPSAVVVHGFRSQGSDPWVYDLISTLFMTSGVENIFVADWANGADKFFLQYAQAVANTAVVAAQVAKFLRWLRSEDESNPIWMIGHSLGAHISGVASRTNSITRITGLDPSVGLRRNDMLSAADAAFVDVIHTDTLRFGTNRLLGDVDIFVNDGFAQPNCAITVIGVQNQSAEPMQEAVTRPMGRQMQSPDPYELFECSHRKAVEYFIESLRTSDCRFWGYQTKPVDCSDADRPAGEQPTAALEPPSSSDAFRSKCALGLCAPIGLLTPLMSVRGRVDVDTQRTCGWSEAMALRDALRFRPLADALKKCSPAVVDRAKQEQLARPSGPRDPFGSAPGAAAPSTAGPLAGRAFATSTVAPAQPPPPPPPPPPPKKKKKCRKRKRIDPPHRLRECRLTHLPPGKGDEGEHRRCVTWKKNKCILWRVGNCASQPGQDRPYEEEEEEEQDIPWEP